MIINLKQETKDSKDTYLKMLEILESLDYAVFDIGAYDKKNHLSEAILIKQTTNNYIN